MRIVTVSHSNAHIRQINFWRMLAVMGHDVLVICPEKWGTLKPEATGITYNGEHASTFEVCPLPVIGADESGQLNMYTFRLIGLDQKIAAWKPDVLYVQQEWDCALTSQAFNAFAGPKAIFVWENLKAPQGYFSSGWDLMVCGNDAAARLHPHRRQVFLPQVGVDTDHFTARPDVERAADVGYIGRPVPEKGIRDLEVAWPTTRITPWTEWLKLPWALSGIKVVAAPSRDTAFWREQAGPYAAWEAAACGCAVVVSNAGAIPWWNKGGFCEPSPFIMVEQGNPESLRRGISEALADWMARGEAGRAWVEYNLSTLVVAKKLVKELEAIV